MTSKFQTQKRCVNKKVTKVDGNLKNRYVSHICQEATNARMCRKFGTGGVASRSYRVFQIFRRSVEGSRIYEGSNFAILYWLRPYRLSPLTPPPCNDASLVGHCQNARSTLLICTVMSGKKTCSFIWGSASGPGLKNCKITLRFVKVIQRKLLSLFSRTRCVNKSTRRI